MSSRFRVCTNLATAIKNLGYKDEISYNQFMYPAEKEHSHTPSSLTTVPLSSS